VVHAFVAERVVVVGMMVAAGVTIGGAVGGVMMLMAVVVLVGLQCVQARLQCGDVGMRAREGLKRFGKRGGRRRGRRRGRSEFEGGEG
jgi:hypothetical protein